MSLNVSLHKSLYKLGSVETHLLSAFLMEHLARKGSTPPLGLTHDANRQLLLAGMTKYSIGFVFNEALLCILSITTNIWLSSLNVPPHFAIKFFSISGGSQLAW